MGIPRQQRATETRPASSITDLKQNSGLATCPGPNGAPTPPQAEVWPPVPQHMALSGDRVFEEVTLHGVIQVGPKERRGEETRGATMW